MISRLTSFCRTLADSDLGIRLRRNESALLGILLVALLVRCVFFVGVNYALDQDEGIYLDQARNMLRGEYRVNFTDKPADYIPDPAEAFQFRYPMVVAPAVFFYLFGINDGAAGAFALLCSLGAVFLTHRIARLFADEPSALLAAFLHALFPLDVMFATRLMPDGPMALFFWLAVYLLIRADRCPVPTGWRPRWDREGLFLASGVAVGMCYFIKLSTVFIAGVMGVYVLASIISTQRLNWRYGLVGVGFFMVLCAEGLCYYAQGDDFWLNLKMNTRVFEGKIVNESPVKIEVIPGVFNFWIMDPTITWYYTRQIFESLNPFTPSLLGWFWAVGLAAVAVIFRNRDRGQYVVAAWFVVLYLMLEFMPVRILFNQDGVSLNYYLVSQRMRYMTVVTLPTVLLCAVFARRLSRFWMRSLVVAVLAVTSVASIQYYHGWFRAGVASLNDAAELLAKLTPRLIYTDYIARNHFDYRLGLGRSRELNQMPVPLENCYVLVGGTRGMDISWEAVRDFRKEALERRDSSWVEIAVIPNPAKDYIGESEDVIIYLVPPANGGE